MTLWSIRPDGSGLRRLEVNDEDLEYVGFIAFSPAGDALAYEVWHGGDRMTPPEVSAYLLHRDGSTTGLRGRVWKEPLLTVRDWVVAKTEDERELRVEHATGCLLPGEVFPRPGGSQVAITLTGGERGPSRRIVLLDVGSGRVVRSFEGIGTLAWSPDGTRFVGIKGKAVVVVRADGTIERRLASCTCVAVAWRPAGSS